MGAVAWAMRQRSVSHPRSSNRTCGFPASGSLASSWGTRNKALTAASSAQRALFLRHTIQLSLKDLDHSRCLQAHRQSPSPCLLRKHTRSQGPSLHRHYPASTVILPCPTPADAAARSDVEAATLAPTGLPRLPEPPFQRAVPTTPADRAGARVDCFPAHAAFPRRELIMPGV